MTLSEAIPKVTTLHVQLCKEHAMRSQRSVVYTAIVSFEEVMNIKVTDYEKVYEKYTTKLDNFLDTELGEELSSVPVGVILMLLGEILTELEIIKS